MSYNHIELFSGCGGLSLGMDKAGFNLLLANELSPMAAESFAYNFLSEDLEQMAAVGNMPKKTIWLSSQFPELKRRLRENPYDYPELKDVSSFSELPEDGMDLAGKLVVGDIAMLNKLLLSSSNYKEAFYSGFGQGGVDLVSGGPPCQSFSLAGLRRKDCEKNTLPWEFAKFVEHVQPKIALLENVSGILRAFKDDDGKKYHAWFEVAKAFASIGYVPLCLHVNAKFTGVAQNRPRFILIAIRFDVCNVIVNSLSVESSDHLLFDNAIQFYKQVQTDLKQLDCIEFGLLHCYDIEKMDKKLFMDSIFFNKLIVDGDLTPVRDAIDDIKKSNPSPPSRFVSTINELFSSSINHPERQFKPELFPPANDRIANHEFRDNSIIVKCRFCVYQILQQIDNKSVSKSVLAVMKGSDTISGEAWNYLKAHKFWGLNDDWVIFDNKTALEKHLSYLTTKKQTQKALVANLPAPAALSIPDDACHYDMNELRVLTAREMARIQSFPDKFVFRSKATTGGTNRRFEVPQYTQIGNAVPPLLALALGKACSLILDRYHKFK